MLYIGCRVDIYQQIETLREIGVRRTFLNARCPEIDKVLDAIKAAGLICDNLHSELSMDYQKKNIHIKYKTPRRGPLRGVL